MVSNKNIFCKCFLSIYLEIIIFNWLYMNHNINFISLDNISLASNEDMYAFSNVIANGGNIMRTVK